MAASFGNKTGPIFCLGKIIVATPGTPVPLNQNVSTNTAFGTVASPSPMCANQLIFQAYAGNTGNIYVCFEGGSKNLTNSIIAILAPGQTLVLGTSNLSNPYQPALLVIDGDTMSNAVQATALIV